MKKHVLFSFFAILISLGYAQTTSNIVVTSGSISTAYSDLTIAINAAPDGSTIYVPGGIHNLVADLTISKQLHFRGDGTFTIATANGLIPQIKGKKMIFTRASNNSTFEGINFGNTIQLLHTTSDLTGNFYLTFNRCRFDYSISASGGGATIGNISLFINECVLPGVALSSSVENVQASNSIFTSNTFSNVDQGSVRNSIFIYTNTTTPTTPALILTATSNFSIINSVIKGNVTTTGVNNTILNCLFDAGSTIGSTISVSNNLFQAFTNIFVNVPVSAFNQAYDYHLKAGCLGINAGNDGTDIGIYGGANPWKDKIVPVSPNVYYKSVSNQNSSDGKINATYKVKAQTY